MPRAETIPEEVWMGAQKLTEQEISAELTKLKGWSVRQSKLVELAGKIRQIFGG